MKNKTCVGVTCGKCGQCLEHKANMLGDKQYREDYKLIEVSYIQWLILSILLVLVPSCIILLKVL